MTENHKTLRDLYENWLQLEKDVKDLVRGLSSEGASDTDIQRAIEEQFGCSHHWHEALLQPVAKSLESSGHYARVEVLGPFGLGATVALHAYKDAEGDEIAASANFRPDLNFDDGGSCLGFVDLHTDTGRYASNTAGHRSGLNHPTVPVPMDTPIGDPGYWHRLMYRHE